MKSDKIFTEIDPAFANWLMGLIDGEGHFAIAFNKKAKSYYCLFQLKLRVDDLKALVSVRDTLGFGRIEIEKKSGVGHHSMVKFIVGDKNGCSQLVSLVDEYGLRSKKSKDFDIWRLAVFNWLSLKAVGNQYNKIIVDWSVMANLRAQIMKVRDFQEVSAIEIDHALRSNVNLRHVKSRDIAMAKRNDILAELDEISSQLADLDA